MNRRIIPTVNVFCMVKLILFQILLKIDIDSSSSCKIDVVLFLLRSYR